MERLLKPVGIVLAVIVGVIVLKSVLASFLGVFVIVLIVVGLVSATTIPKYRQMQRRKELRANPPEKVAIEIQLPFGETESARKMSALLPQLAQLLTAADADEFSGKDASALRKTRAQGLGSMKLELHCKPLVDDHGQKTVKARFYVVVDADRAAEVKRKLRTSFRDGFVNQAAADAIPFAEVNRVYQQRHPFKPTSEVVAEKRADWQADRQQRRQQKLDALAAP